MTDPWKPHGDVEYLYDQKGDMASLQYLRGPRKTGAHEVRLHGDDVLRALPDSETHARGRAAAIREALTREGPSLLETVVGALVLHGATNLELNGEPLIRVGAGKWLVLLDDNGTVEARYVKGPDR